jgi:hypothetical protein
VVRRLRVHMRRQRPDNRARRKNLKVITMSRMRFHLRRRFFFVFLFSSFLFSWLGRIVCVPDSVPHLFFGLRLWQRMPLTILVAALLLEEATPGLFNIFYDRLYYQWFFVTRFGIHVRVQRPTNSITKAFVARMIERLLSSPTQHIGWMYLTTIRGK